VQNDLTGAGRLYQRCFEELLLIQRAGDSSELPFYDEALLLREMRLFTDWCCGSLLKLVLSDAEQQLIERTFAQLVTRALRQPRVLVHRDYHSRNLMLLSEPGRALGVIDFQDAVRGPATYDLVSLLKDCYIEWPAATVRDWALAYARQARAAGIAIASDDREFLDDFALMGAQRHLKVLGIFCRLWLRDGKPGYLKDLPLTFRYTLDALSAHADYEAFADFLRQRIATRLPAALAAAQADARQKGLHP
jgi:aminoglycoside/choline kinase family phosphotransferase